MRYNKFVKKPRLVFLYDNGYGWIPSFELHTEDINEYYCLQLAAIIRNWRNQDRNQNRHKIQTQYRTVQVNG